MIAVNFYQRCFSPISQSILDQFTLNFASTLCNYSGAYLENFVKFEKVVQKLDHLTCSRISRLKLNEINIWVYKGAS